MTNSAIIALAAAIAIAISTLGPSIGQGLTAKQQWKALLVSLMQQRISVQLLLLHLLLWKLLQFTVFLLHLCSSAKFKE